MVKNNTVTPNALDGGATRRASGVALPTAQGMIFTGIGDLTASASAAKVAVAGVMSATKASSRLLRWRAIAVDGVVIAVALGAFLAALTASNEGAAYDDLRLYLL